VVSLSIPFLISKPFRIDYPVRVLDIPVVTKTINIKIRAKKGDIIVKHGQAGKITIGTWASGQAMPDIQVERNLSSTQDSEQWYIHYTVTPSTRFFLEYQSHTTFWVPRGLNITWDLFTELGEVMRDDLK